MDSEAIYLVVWTGGSKGLDRRVATPPTLCAFIIIVSVSEAAAFTVTGDLEVITTPGVGAGWVTVPFENTYANPVPVCTHRLPSTSDPSAVVRIDQLGATGMQVRLQQMPNSGTVPTTDVHCVIADEGAYDSGGLKFEARTVLSDATNGNNADDRWTTSTFENVTGLLTQTYSAGVVLGQVITFNDTNASVYTNNDCESRGNRPFDSGFADGICVTKHIGELSGSRADETLGFIVIESSSGTVNNIDFVAAVGADNVRGVGNGPPYTYSVSGDFEAGVATQAEEAGGQGGWAVFYGADPFPNNQLRLAIDEEVAAGDLSRTHTAEPLSYWVFRRRPEFTLAKTVDAASIAQPRLLAYEIVLENTAQLELTGVTVSDILPDGSSGVVSGPVESFPAGTANVLEPGETWTYTASYSVSQAEIDAGLPLTNTANASTTEYSSFALLDETDNAVTTIVPASPALSIDKSYVFTTGAPDAGVGDVVQYTYRVRNSGNVTITNVSVSDVHNGFGSFPANPSIQSLSDNAPIGDSSGSTGGTAWASLAPGDELIFTADYAVVQQDVDELQ